jgi:hypothetical protein
VERNQFVHSFRVLAPTLDYSAELFSIQHGPTLYPSAGSVGKVIATELPDESSMIEWVREQLASERTVRLLQALLAQLGT